MSEPFYARYVYHAFLEPQRIDTQEQFDALDESWKASPPEALEYERLKSDPAEAERLAQLEQEEAALRAHLADVTAAEQQKALDAQKAALEAEIAEDKAKVETEEEELARLERETRPDTLDSQK